MGVDGISPTLHSTANDRRTGHEYLELITGWAMLEAALWTTGREQVIIGLLALCARVAFYVLRIRRIVPTTVLCFRWR